MITVSCVIHDTSDVYFSLVPGLSQMKPRCAPEINKVYLVSIYSSHFMISKSLRRLKHILITMLNLKLCMPVWTDSRCRAFVIPTLTSERHPSNAILCPGTIKCSRPRRNAKSRSLKNLHSIQNVMVRGQSNVSFRTRSQPGPRPLAFDA